MSNIRQRKANTNLYNHTAEPNKLNDNDTYSTKWKRCCFISSILMFIVIVLHQCVNFIIDLGPGHAITHILTNRRDVHLSKYHEKKFGKILPSHQNGHHYGDIEKFFIYPRRNTSADIKELPSTLQTHLFCGHNNNCSDSELCTCPIIPLDSGHTFGIYPKYEFPSNPNIYNSGWQKHFKIGYPPKFNASLYAENESHKVSEAWNLFAERADELNQCSLGAGMWAHWTKPGYHKCIARVIGERLKFKPGAKVLDIGCGCGHSLALWTWWFGIWGLGFDFKLSNVEYANNMARNNNLTYYTYHASVQSLYESNWIPDKSFDFVISQAVLLYLEKANACQAIRKSIDILKKGGVLWLAWNTKIPALTGCVESYREKRDGETISIDYYWLNETDFLGSCRKAPPRPSLVVKRLN